MNSKLKRFLGFNKDFVGSLLAVVCAVHCMVVPLIASVGLFAMETHNHAFDFIFMAAGLGVAIYAMWKDFTVHGSYLPSLIVSFGFVMLFIGVESHGALLPLSIFGGVLITFAHYINWKLGHSHELA